MQAMILNWEALKSAAGSRLAQSSVLAPIIGWVLVRNDVLSRFLAEKFNFQDFQTPSASIYSLYCGLFLFGLGALLHGLFCPTIIKSYLSRDDFRTRKLVTTTIAEASRMQQNLDVPKNLAQNVADALNREQLDELGGPVSHEQFVRNRKAELLDLLGAYYDWKNQSHVVIRTVTTALVVIGGLLAIIPSLETFRSVVSLLWGKITQSQ
jgi:hypothetical protein